MPRKRRSASGGGAPPAKVVILCGGKGTRLQEETDTKPKPMALVGGKPILWHIMKTYAVAGFTDFVLCLGYKGEVIRRWFLDYDLSCRDFTITLGEPGGVRVHGELPDRGWRVTLVDTGEEAMTGARLKRVERYVDTEHLHLTYGDGVARIDVRDLYAFHRKHGLVGTVTGVRPPSRFGELRVEGDRVREFSEKPQTHEGCINGGFFVFDRRIFEYVTDDDACTFERAPLARLAKDGQLGVYRLDDFWACMDTQRDLTALNRMWDRGAAPWRTWPG